jgi:coiled-coil domain-containing protein 12
MSGEDRDERAGMEVDEEPNSRRVRTIVAEDPDERPRNEDDDDEGASDEDDDGHTAGEKGEGKKKRKEPNPHEGKLKFRNYAPRDGFLRDLRIEAAPLPSMVGEINRKLIMMDARKNEDLLALAPKKPNWDLKRDIEKKLEALEKRTQRAIVLLLKQKLEGEEGGSLEEAKEKMMIEAQQEGQLSHID